MSHHEEMPTFGDDSTDDRPVATATSRVQSLFDCDESSSESAPVVNPSRWARSGSMYWAVQDSTNALAGGMYSGGYSNGVGFYLDKKSNMTDGLIHLPDSASDAVLREINEFADLKESFLSRKMVYKRGIFLWGPPGSGKTSTLAQIVDIVINKMQGIAFMVEDPTIAIECLKLIRKVEPERQIVALFEDLDALIQMYGEAKYLSLLDGENQVDNIIYVATTNYPERIDKRFVNRPSRFDTVIKVGMPTASAREIFLRHREPLLNDAQVQQYVDLSEGFSLAHLREFIILTCVFKRDISWAAQKLRAMMTGNLSSTQDNNRDIGFTSSPKERGSSIIEMPRKIVNE